MSRKLLIALTVLCFACAGSTFAAVENIKVSGDITPQTVLRNLSMGQHWSTGSTLSDNDHAFFISQIRLRFDADLTEGVSAVIGLISERTWGENNSLVTNSGDDIQLDLGYIELKEFLWQPLNVTVGRQRLRYGNALVVGDPDTNQGVTKATAANQVNPTGLPVIATDLSLQKSFDSVKLVFDYAPWTVDAVFSQIRERTTNVTRLDDQYMWGLNAAYDWSSYNGVTELYFFAADKAPRTTAVSVADHNNSRIYTPGLRVQFDPNDKWTVGVEGAFQGGRRIMTANTETDDIRAFAGQANVEYRFLNDYNAKVGLNYSYLSGDQESNVGRYEGWNPMWEDQTPAELINILMDNSNAQLIGLTASVMPKEDLTLGMTYVHAMLAEKLNSITYNPSFGPASSTSLGGNYIVMAGKKHFGDEIDGHILYDYTEDVQLQLSGAYFMPGSVFNEDMNNKASYSVRGGLTLNF